jgi:hypothetical protein
MVWPRKGLNRKHFGREFLLCFWVDSNAFGSKWGTWIHLENWDPLGMVFVHSRAYLLMINVVMASFLRFEFLLPLLYQGFLKIVKIWKIG